MQEHHIEVPKTARYYTLGTAGSALRDLWVVLHGYRQLAGRFLNRFRVIQDPVRLIVAPEALSRFYVERTLGRHGPESRVGAAWMTREDRSNEIRDYVGYLDRVRKQVMDGVPGRSVRTTILGFSQGLHAAARWAIQGQRSPERLILWGDYLPPDVDMARAAERLEGVDVILVVGDRDPGRNTELAEEQAGRLREWGITYRTLTHKGGHELDPMLLQDLARP